MWAVNTPDGIIIIDTIFDYSVEDEIVERPEEPGRSRSGAASSTSIVSHGAQRSLQAARKLLQDHY